MSSAHVGNIVERSHFTVAFVTLGCAKNEVDTANMKRRLSLAGYGIIEDVEAAHAIVVNTCSFIQAATEESIGVILELADLPSVRDESTPLIVAGCMPARYGEDLESELTEARAFVPCSREDDIVEVLDRVLSGRSCGASPVAGGAENTASLGLSYRPSTDFASGAFAYVKISDGCDRRCAYCVIPFIRGPFRSFSYDEIHSEVSRRVSEGAGEIVLIAQDTGCWGVDLRPRRSLAWLLEQLATVFPRTWFRVLYLEPEGVSDELLSVMARYDNVCPYLDIPLQHVSSDVLRLMNRRGSRVEFEALFDRIRKALPDVTLRTTLIAGFPGETEEHFEELCDFVEDGPFSYIGVFPYSREEGTAAFDLPDQLDEDEKLSRAQTLRDIADAVSAARIAERQGEEVFVLVEGEEEDGQLYGRTMAQAPEVDGVTYLNGGSPGEIVKVRLVDTLMYEMEGELV